MDKVMETYQKVKMKVQDMKLQVIHDRDYDAYRRSPKDSYVKLKG